MIYRRSFVLANRLLYRELAVTACVVASLGMSSCNRKEDTTKSEASTPEQRARKADRSPVGGSGSDRRGKSTPRSPGSDPMVEVKEATKLLAEDYLAGKTTAAEVAALLLSHEEDHLASRAWNELLGSIRAEDLETFFTALREKGDSGVRAEILPALVSRANSLDPALAETLIDKLPEGSLRMTCIQSLFLGFPESITRHAAFLSQLTTDRDIMALGITYGDALGKLDSETLGTFVSKLTEGRARKLALEALASKLGEESSGIKDLSRRLETVPEKSDTFRQAAFLSELEKRKEGGYDQISLSQVKPEQQAALAYATATMIHRNSTPSDAMNWLLREGAGTPGAVSKGVSTTMVRWLNSDPMEAAGWLEQQPASPLKDVALQRLMQYLDKPEEAATKAQWAGQFSDPKLAKQYSGKQ